MLKTKSEAKNRSFKKTLKTENHSEKITISVTIAINDRGDGASNQLYIQTP